MGKVFAGTLNKRVEIQRRVVGQDTWGQPLEQWTCVACVWANIKNMTGAAFSRAEQQAGGSEISATATSIRIRKRRGITAAMRVAHGADVYDIRAVLPDEETGEYMDLAVTLGAGDGG